MLFESFQDFYKNLNNIDANKKYTGNLNYLN